MMKRKADYTQARDLLLELAVPVGTEKIRLENSAGRILAEPLTADENIPPFDRSPYDGYALRAEDTAAASEASPVTLDVIGTLPAGETSEYHVTKGTAVRIMTGAPIPAGADTVVMYEKTRFDDKSVTLSVSLRSGDNIVRAGDDVKIGEKLAEAGTRIDAGLAGTLASLGKADPLVYKKPAAGLIMTGDELAEPGEVLLPGKIRNSNRYTLTAALQQDGCEVTCYGTAGDDPEMIAEMIRKALRECDFIVLSGGVSAGDKDLTPQAMELAGCALLVHGVRMKPGMACCYGTAGGKPVFALSGNPAAALTNYLAVVRPAVRKIAGNSTPLPEEFEVTLADGFNKRSPQLRFLRGRLEISGGTAYIKLPKDQGNAVISSAIGCDVMAVIPGGSGPLPPGTKLKGIRI